MLFGAACENLTHQYRGLLMDLNKQREDNAPDPIPAFAGSLPNEIDEAKYGNILWLIQSISKFLPCASIPRRFGIKGKVNIGKR
jgi:hypothetical protein